MHLAAMFEFLDVIPKPALVSEMTGSDNSSNRPRFLNLAFLERIGYTLDEIPDIERWFEIAYPDPVFRDGARNEWYQAINKSVAEGRRTAEASALIQCKDGRQRWFLVTAQVRSESMPNMHVVTFRDIHDLKVASDRNHYLSQTDQLTQVSSRHAGQQRLESEFFRFSRGGAPFAVVMCDVDHFKYINDQMGHVGGDHVLCQVADALRSTCRSFDEVVRWGGDEFLLIFPAIELNEVIVLAERLRKAVQSLDCIWNGRQISPTLSLGCAVSLPGQSDIDLLRAVDEALYSAKRRGRNAVGF